MLMTGGNVEVNDKRAGVALSLPLDRLSATWNPAIKAYSIVATSLKGGLGGGMRDCARQR